MSEEFDLSPAAGSIAEAVQQELPGLRLDWVSVPARRQDSPPAVKQRLRQLSSRYRGANAVALRTKRDFDGAEQEYLAALHVDPRFAVAAFELGLTRSAAGKGEGAIDAFCRALAIDPSLERARAELKKLQVDPTACGS